LDAICREKLSVDEYSVAARFDIGALKEAYEMRGDHYMQISSCVLMLVFVACGPAVAAQMRVADLQKFCNSASEVEKTACSFYIWGVIEGASIGSGTVKDSSGAFGEARAKPYCVPEGVSKSDIELVVRKKMGEDLAAFPRDRELPAVSFVVAVVAHQFPCGKGK
jgi:hypothetical protein